MRIYSRYLLPTLLNLAMRQRELMARRAEIVPQAQGRVLEIGIGSGLNLPFYGREVTHVDGIDPSPELLGQARNRAKAVSFPVDLPATPALRGKPRPRAAGTRHLSHRLPWPSCGNGSTARATPSGSCRCSLPPNPGVNTGTVCSRAYLAICLGGCLSAAPAQQGEQGLRTAGKEKDCCTVVPGLSGKSFTPAALPASAPSTAREVAPMTSR